MPYFRVRPPLLYSVKTEFLMINGMSIALAAAAHLSKMEFLLMMMLEMN